MKLLRGVLSQPTAPFREDRIAALAFRFAGRVGLAAARDAHGNVLLRYQPLRRRGVAHWVFTAHMDHPGFVTMRQRGRSVWTQFCGEVGREYFRGARVRLFAPGGDVRATVATVRRGNGSPWLTCRLELDKPAEVLPGVIGMWDLPAVRIRGRVVSARAVDDVAGVAAVLCAMGRIAARRPPGAVTALLTRAEEAGFVGALGACNTGQIPPAAQVIVIEASAQRSGARMGEGVVIRVGDNARIFDASLTAHLRAVAAKVARRDRNFRFVRQLMSGGTCEATVFGLYGHTSAGVCLPLGNYHNMGPAGKIAAEKIHLDDFNNLVKLLVAVAAGPAGPEQTDAAMRKRLDRMFAQRRRYL